MGQVVNSKVHETWRFFFKPKKDRIPILEKPPQGEAPLQMGAVYKVGDGQLTQFWTNVWLTSVPLRIHFPKLFEICDDINSSVTECAGMNEQINLRRNLGAEATSEWSNLQTMLTGVTLNNNKDEVPWGLSPSRTFTTSSLYKFLLTRGMECKLAKHIWKCRISLKIQTFMWQAFQDRVQTAQQLKNRHWKGSVSCSLCGAPEDIDHLLFRCPLPSSYGPFLEKLWDRWTNPKA
jgi:hypothetical protein